MAAPNIVNVTTITGVTSVFSGIAVTTGPRGDVGITTVVSNPSGSGKVLKINTLVATSIGSTTGITLQHYDNKIILEATTVSIGMTTQFRLSPHWS